jgi:hypothetical protein
MGGLIVYGVATMVCMTHRHEETEEVALDR